MIGAAFAAAAPGVPSWSTGFKDGNDMGGLIAAALAPAGGFGKFLLVLLALSTSSAAAPTLYSFGELKLGVSRLLSPNIIILKYCFSISTFFKVVLSLKVSFLGNCFMAITPFFARVPRYVFTVLSTAM